MVFVLKYYAEQQKALLLQKGVKINILEMHHKNFQCYRN